MDWHRSDYILRGEYCPLSALHRQVDVVRLALDADLLLHIAVDHEVVLRSLNWASGEPGAVSESLAQRLRAANYRTENSDTNSVLVAIASKYIDNSVTNMPQAEVSDLIRRVQRIKMRRAQVADMPSLPEPNWTGLVLNHTGKDDVRPRDGEARSILLAHNRPTERIDNGQSLTDLSVMLKCTFEANTRRDAVVMNQVAQRLSSTVTGKAGFEEVAFDALTLACEITGSSAGAVYLIAPGDPPHFERAAMLSPRNFDYPPLMPFDTNTTVGRSIARHRAYQDVGVGGLTAPLERVVTAVGGTELATPIAGPLANTLEPAIGAIVLYLEESSQGYGAYERALVRNVSLRLALMHTSMATQDIATAISALRSQSPGRLHVTQSSPSEPLLPDAKWPRDIGLAVSKFNQPLRQLADSTQSHSVSLRIALPDKANNVHGLALVRVAAHPPERIGESFEFQKEGDPGAHWDVVRSGVTIYVPDTESDARYKETRIGTKSALCVPVRIEGILAGTLNLESPVVDNYTAFMPLVIAFCGAIGRTLADARAALETRVLDSAAHALTRRHEFSSELKTMREGLEKLDASGSKEALFEKVNSLGTLIQDMREPDRQSQSPASLWQIFQDCAAQAQLEFGVIAKPKEAIFHESLDARASQAVATILRTVLRNVSYHSDLSAYDARGERVPRVRFSTIQIQGDLQAVIILENRSRNYLDENQCRALYRYPVEGPGGELRLGTYIAGLNARRIGARIHAALLDDLKTLRTTIIIPVGALL